MAHGDDEGRDPFGGGTASRGFDPDPVPGATGPVAFRSVPAADRANGVIDRVVSELKKLGDEVSKLSKRLATTTGGKAAGGLSTVGSYTQQHITGAAGKLTGSWRGLYTTSDGYVDEAARIMAYQQGAQIIGQMGGGVNRYFAGAGGGTSILDWAATQRSQLYGTYQEGRREDFNRRQAGLGGYTSAADLAQASVLNNRMGGSFANLRGISNAAALNPTLGMAGFAGMQAQLLQPQALASMVPFGGGAVANGGRRRQFDQMLEHYALTATGQSRFGAGGLTQRFARATFSEGGQGRQNLRQLGVSDDMIDSIMTYSAQSARAGRALDMDDRGDSKVFRGSILENQANRARRNTNRDVRIFEDSRDAQANWNDLMGRANQELGRFIDNIGAASGLFGAGKVGGALQSLSQVGMLGLMLRGGGPGLGGMLGRVGTGGLGGMAATAGAAGLAGGAGYLAGSAVGKLVPGSGRASGAARGALKWGATGAGIGAVVGGGVPGALIGGGIGLIGGGIAGAFGLGDAVLEGPGRTAGLNSQFLERLKAMFEANPRLRLTSGHRTRTEQERLYANRGSNPYPVAKPGTSRHESGIAADLGGDLAWAHAHAAEFGLSFPMPDKDPVHVELAGAQPMHQGGGTVDDLIGGGGGGVSFGAEAMGGLSGGSVGSMLGGRLKSSFSPVTFMGGNVVLGGGSGAVAASAGGGGGGNLLARLRAAGLSGDRLRTAYAVAMAESGGQSGAWKNDNVEDSRGVFQINVDGRTSWGRSRASKYGDLFNMDNNISAMMDISGGGQNWNAWSTYKNGAYKKYMDAGIGDAVVGTPARGMSVGGSRTLVLQNLHLNIKIDEVSEREAQRLGYMFLDFLAAKQAEDHMGAT